MSRYGPMFEALAARGEGAFVPFVMLGDPDAATSLRAIETLLAHGADALELGIPFSDPVADGPVIQRAAARALAGGATVERSFALVQSLRERHADVPIGLLVYANLVVQGAPARFYGAAARAGVDSVLVADVPAIEAPPFAAAAREAGVEPVLLLPADAGPETVRRVARLGGGYTYLLARAGVTGAETQVRPPPAALLARLDEEGGAPPLVGFGISTPAQVRPLISAGAAGVITGSAVVALIEQHAATPAALDRALGEFADGMKAATMEARPLSPR
jgi:tryptophan synthase alpha chain